MSRSLAVLAAAATLGVFGASAGAHTNVEIRLLGRYFTEPATVQVIVAVDPRPQNRVLRIEADGEEMFRSSEIELAGDSDKRLHSIQFKNLAAGSYTLRAEVLSSSESVIAMAEEPLLVTGH